MGNYSPLRYPGGKSALYPAISGIIKSNKMDHCIYVEPFAGGANIAWSLLIDGVVDFIIINDADRAVYSFWRAITESTHWFIEKVESVPVTVEEWHKQRAILQGAKRYSKELGFAMFFLNRTNRSGILDAGPIGGYDQSGTYKIDCRFNKEVLIKKISKIAECKNSVRIYNQDISAFLRRFLPRWKNSGESYLNSMLMCPSDRDVKEALTIPCTWATESRIRVHFEWVYDGDFVYLVQADEEELAKGLNPTKVNSNLEKENIDTVGFPHCLRPLKVEDVERYRNYAKIQNPLLYRRLELSTAPLYILDDSCVLKSLSDGVVPSDLEL